jgi:hypothetical protein
MKDRAAKYSASKFDKRRGDAVLVAYVIRTPKGKIRLKRIGIRLQGMKEEPVCELPPTDPKYVFENDYKVRKATHEEMKRSAKFARFYDSSARVLYDVQ